MELIIYLTLILFGLASLIINFKRSISHLYLIPVSLMWSLSMRTAELNADFTYYTFMMTQEGLFGVVLANLTQPVLYTFHWSINNLLDNTYLTWVISDLTLLFIFYLAILNLGSIFENKFKRPELKRFYPAVFLILLISWPYYLGFNLTYRQFAATVIFIYGLGFIKRSWIKTTLLFTLSISILFTFKYLIL